MKNHYIQMLIGLLVGFGAWWAWTFYRAQLFFLIFGSTSMFAAPTMNSTQFQLAPKSPHSVAGLPKLEAEAAFWQAEFKQGSQSATSATLYTTATLSESFVTAVPLPARGDFFVTLTSGTAHHPTQEMISGQLPDGTPGWRVSRIPVPGRTRGVVNSPTFVSTLEVEPLTWSVGRVLDGTGQPLAGVTVEGIGATGLDTGRPPQQGARTLTGPDGRYRVQSVAQFFSSSARGITTRAGIRFQKLGYTHAGNPVGILNSEVAGPIPAETRYADVAMQEGRVVRGRVQDVKGAPVAGARVTLRGLERNGSYSWAWYRTDARGEYAGTVRTSAQALLAHAWIPGHNGFVTREDPKADSLPPITLAPPRELTLTLAGAVPSSTDRMMLDLRQYSPLTHKWLEATLQNPSDSRTVIPADLDGAGRIGGDWRANTAQVHVGSYVRVRAISERDGLASPWIVIDPAANGPVRKTLTLQRLATVSGVISDSTGQAVPGESVVAKGALGEYASVQSGSNGSFTLKNIPLEATEIIVGEHSGAPARVRLPVNEAEPLNVRIEQDRSHHRQHARKVAVLSPAQTPDPKRRLRFQVRDAETGEIIRSPKFDSDNTAVPALTLADEDTYEAPFPFFHPRSVSAPGYHREIPNWENGDTTQVIRLTPLSHVEGRVLDAQGNTVPLQLVRRVVHMFPATNLEAQLGFGGDESRFGFSGLTKGELNLIVTPREPFAPFRVKAAVTQSRTTQTLTRLVAPMGREAVFRLRNKETGQAIAGTTVSAVVTAVNFDGLNTPPREAVSDGEGRAHVRGLLQGYLSVRVGNVAYLTDRNLVTSVPIDLELPLGTGKLRVRGFQKDSPLRHLAIETRGVQLNPWVWIPDGYDHPATMLFENLPAGRYALDTGGGGHRWIMLVGEVPTVDVAPGQEAELDLSGDWWVRKLRLPRNPDSRDLTWSEFTAHWEWTHANGREAPTPSRMGTMIDQEITVAAPPGVRVTRLEIERRGEGTWTISGAVLNKAHPATPHDVRWEDRVAPK